MYEFDFLIKKKCLLILIRIKMRKTQNEKEIGKEKKWLNQKIYI